MSDVTLSYKGSDILELSDSGSATLKTGGTYCEDDIEVEYVKPSGGSTPSSFTLIDTFTVSADVAQFEITKPNGWTYKEFAIIADYNLSESTQLYLYSRSKSTAKVISNSNTTTGQSDLLYIGQYFPSFSVGSITVDASWRGALKRANALLGGPSVAATVQTEDPFPLLFIPSKTTATILQGSTFALYGR